MFNYNNRRLSVPNSVAVSQARLRVCGAQNWTQRSARVNQDRYVVVFNTSASLPLNVYYLVPDGDPNTAPLVDVLPPQSQGIYLVQSMDQVLVNRDVASTDAVTAYERLAR